MSPPESILETQTAALLRRLAREEETRVRRLRTEADEQARDILKRARAEARTRVHQAIGEARREADTALASRRAALDTRRRRAQQATLRLVLDQAWQRLPDALRARWLDPEAREQWCRAACQQAVRVLRDTTRVRIEVGSDDAPAVTPQVLQELEALGIAAAVVEPVATLGPGLRIRGGDACLDATLPGLLAARDRVAAELLAEFASVESAPVQESAQ